MIEDYVIVLFVISIHARRSHMNHAQQSSYDTVTGKTQQKDAFVICWLRMANFIKEVTE